MTAVLRRIWQWFVMRLPTPTHCGCDWWSGTVCDANGGPGCDFYYDPDDTDAP